MTRPSHSEFRILCKLDQGYDMSSSELAHALGYTRIRSEAQLLRLELESLAKRGWTEKLRAGRWKRTAAGTDAMNRGAGQ